MSETIRIISTQGLLGSVADAMTDAHALQEITLAAHLEDEEDTKRWERHDETRRTARDLELIHRRLTAFLGEAPEDDRAGGRTYRGRRTRTGHADIQVTILQDEGPPRVETLDCRNDLFNHSPDGAEWGYAGSGPAQLALGILADATGDDRHAVRRHQDFKRDVIQGIRSIDWTIRGEDVAAWVEDHP